MIRILTALAVLGCLVGATSTAFGQTDDSVWINQGIASAIRNGQTSYSVPSGTYQLQNPIVIPPGTSNFTLKGAGSTNTILTTPTTALNGLIVVGSIPILWNNWGLTNLTNYPVNAVAQGNTTIYVQPGTPITVGNYYCLWDAHAEWANNARQTNVLNHAEITKVKAYNSSNGAVTLDQTTARAYDSTAELCACNAQMCNNITVQGFGMNGQVTGSTDASCSLLQVGLGDRVTTSDMAATNFLTQALLFVNTRNVSISNCNLSNATATGPGMGYGYTLSRCRLVTINNCTATNMYQGFICHCGTTDSTIEYSSCSSCDFDCHGMDERRINFLYDTGNVTGIQIGNQSWPEGDQNVTITGGSYMYGINLCAYATNVTCNNVAFGRIFLWSDLDGITNPAWNQYATNIVFNSCSFNAPHDILYECPQLGTMKFSNCTFEVTQAAWASIFQIKQMNPRGMSFSGCTFKDDCTTGYVPFVIATPGISANISIANSSFSDAGGAACAVQIQNGFVGTGSFTGNSFSSKGAKAPVFLSNQSSSPHITNTNNTAQSS